ncbi:MAG: hypothetical protein LBC93_03480 [Synergistaceae bacterium]|jgi:hypothetical protein|nr:hypothetical protein [Synergistaceae bacterium]
MLCPPSKDIPEEFFIEAVRIYQPVVKPLTEAPFRARGLDTKRKTAIPHGKRQALRNENTSSHPYEDGEIVLND